MIAATLEKPINPLAIVIGFLLILAVSVVAQPTVIEKSLDKIKQAPPAAADSFDFVVLGDSRSGEPVVQPEVFKQAIREFNILQPAFVVDVGDLILGGAAEGLAPQWDEFERVIAACEVPFLPVTGNHDISDAATEKIWLQRMGPLRYAFSYGNSRFIMLNSEEVGALDRIPDEQVAWLKKDLETTNAKNIFLFLHQPYFTVESDPANFEENWKKRWSNVAEVLRGRPVKVVFGGHWHLYRDCGVHEGVRYAITGGGGAGLRNDKEEEGGFHHYLLVRVRGDKVSWSVVKPGAVLPENVANSDRVGELHNVRNKWVACEEVPVPYGEGCDRSVSITVMNPGERPLESTITWEVPAGWSVSPKEKAYSIAGGENTAVTFQVKADNPESVRFPAPKFATRYTGTKFGPPVEVTTELRLVPTTNAAHAPGPVTPDGDLSEWQAAKPVPLTYAHRMDIQNTADLQSQARFMWDESNFYLAVETQDNDYVQPYAGDIVWSADNVQLFIDRWSWGLTLTKTGPEVFLYWGVDVSAETVNTDVKLGIKRDGTHITYEAVFPATMMKPLELKAGNSCRFSLIMNDLDTSGPRHWLELTPGAGSSPKTCPRTKVILVK